MPHAVANERPSVGPFFRDERVLHEREVKHGWVAARDERALLHQANAFMNSVDVLGVADVAVCELTRATDRGVRVAAQHDRWASRLCGGRGDAHPVVPVDLALVRETRPGPRAAKDLDRLYRS